MKKSGLRLIQDYVMITLGIFLNAFAWTAFLVPAHIVGGGVTGMAAVFYYATGFPIGYSYLIVNAFLLVLAFKILGAKFALTTVYGISATSIFFMILPEFITSGLVDDQFMSALLGAGLSGVGIGIAISNGGNSGGTDIVALIITKYKNISPGRIILYIDVAIIGSSWFLEQDIEKLVYGYVVMAVFAYALDLVLVGKNQSYQFMIMTKKQTLIAERIASEIGRGVTLLHGYGWYSKQETDIVMVIARKEDKIQIMRIIKETDERAFISVARVQGVFGQNFDKIKI